VSDSVNFSQEWDQRYTENAHLSVWPWSDLVSLVRRNCRSLGSASRVLELGCGAGANIPFFEALGVQYHGLEGSPAIVTRLHERFPELAERIVVADFTVQQPFAAGFDLVVDRAALTHNSSAAIESGLARVWESLRPGGIFVGVDWFSTRYSEFLRGEPGTDAYTRANYQDGPFAGTGRVHFSDERHLRELFGRFDLLFLEEKITQCKVPADAGQFASWNLVARKVESGAAAGGRSHG
jgi:SAM-dependent methyltransferase